MTATCRSKEGSETSSAARRSFLAKMWGARGVVESLQLLLPLITALLGELARRLRLCIRDNLQRLLAFIVCSDFFFKLIETNENSNIRLMLSLFQIPR